jgi:hypothetical protein
MLEEMASIEKNKTWSLVDLPAGQRAIGLKWVFKLKRDVLNSWIDYLHPWIDYCVIGSGDVAWI